VIHGKLHLKHAPAAKKVEKKTQDVGIAVQKKWKYMKGILAVMLSSVPCFPAIPPYSYNNDS